MGPPNNVGFRDITSLQDIVGVYSNAGEDNPLFRGGSTQTVHYLSRKMWPSESIDHAAITKIEFRIKEQDSLIVTAHSVDEPVKVAEYIYGKDFTFTDGRIRLRRYVEGPGDNIFGIAYSDENLGLDERGDGKYRLSGGGAGIALLIPFIFVASDDVRFIRISE